MLPWSQLGTAQMPGGGGELRLMQRGDEFSIMLAGGELMNSRRTGSEEALATLTCERLRGCAQPRLLIGGLGLGFTLRSALDALGSDAEVTVAELVPELIVWARSEMAAVFGTCLDDPRVVLYTGDVGDVIRSHEAAFDAILLDVDNSPKGLIREANDSLYSTAGLAAAHAALRPGGVFAIWSSDPDAKFARRLSASGFAVDEVTARSGPKNRGTRHVVWLARRM